MPETGPFWSLAELVSESADPDTFQVSLEDIVAHTGRLVDGELSRYEAKGTPFVKGDVLFGKLRPYLAKCWLADRSGTAGGDIHVYRPASDVEPRYLRYVVGSRDFTRYAEAASKGVKMPRVEWMGLRELQIYRPSITTQQRIADYLDREIGEIDAMLAKMDELANELHSFHHANIAALGRKLVGPGKRIRIGLLLVKQFREVRHDDGVVTAFRDGQVVLRSRRREEGFTMSFSETGYQGVDPGDFVLHGLDGFAGAVGVAEDRGKASPVYHVCVATALTSERFMAWALRALAANGFLEAYAFSVRQRSVDFRNWTTFAGLPITYVDLAEQKRVADHLDAVTGHIDIMLGKVAELKTLLIERRAALITDVVTGRKEVA